MTALRAGLRLAGLFAVIALGVLLASFVALLERLRSHDLMPLRQRLTCWWLRRLRSALPVRVSVHGKRPEQPMLWVSNHISWVDIPLLGALAPLSFLSKAEVRQWPLAGWLAEKAGTLFIRRGSGDAGRVNQVLAGHLEFGRSVLVFPEGTTTDGSGVRNFHGRLLASAIELNLPLQPVAIRYRRHDQLDTLAPFIGDDDLPSHLWRLLCADSGEVEIHLLPPVASTGLDRNQLAQRVRGVIEAAISDCGATAHDLAA